MKQKYKVDTSLLRHKSVTSSSIGKNISILKSVNLLRKQTELLKDLAKNIKENYRVEENLSSILKYFKYLTL